MKIAVPIFLVLVLLTGMVFFQKPMWLFYYAKLRAGDRMISRIEAFRASHRYLPATLQETGYENSDEKVFYERISDNEYCLWFGTTLGESETYLSSDKKWEEGRGCVSSR